MAGSAVRLRRQIPFTVAMDLLLTAREVSAQEAKEIGLIGYVVPDGSALDKALEIAEVISNNGPLAVQAILRSTRGNPAGSSCRPGCFWSGRRFGAGGTAEGASGSRSLSAWTSAPLTPGS